MAVLGLRFCAGAFSSCGKRGPLFIAVRGPPTIVASLVAEHRLQMRRLSNCGPRAQPLRGMRDPPRPGLEPVSPALAGGLPTTAPPGKPWKGKFLWPPPSSCPLPLQGELCSMTPEEEAATAPPWEFSMQQLLIDSCSALGCVSSGFGEPQNHLDGLVDRSFPAHTHTPPSDAVGLELGPGAMLSKDFRWF